ncbi:MAG: hypothetical protein U9Q34_08285 [Elusimicrobiota bacterium]|nr:hypothetical protein [Elusimicrobiota bacterium]
MKKLSALILITALISPVCAIETESLRNSIALDYKSGSAIESTDLEDAGIPMTVGIDKASQDVKPIQYIILSRMTARSVKIIGLTLQGLETMNNSNKAPSKYTRQINRLADDLIRALNTMGKSLEYKHYKQLFTRLVHVRSKAQRLKESLKLIEGHENYGYWFGTDIENSAKELDTFMKSLKKSEKNIYSFIIPELKNEKLKKEWETFVATGISDLNRWEKLYMEKKLSYSEFTDLVDAKVSLKEMWELYQESLKNKSSDKGIKACFIKEIKDNNCIYKCIGGSTYSTPIERPLPNFDYDKPSIVCPQIVFPF